MKKPIPVRLLVLCLIPFRIAFAQTASSGAPLAHGRANFEARCSGCHGADGNGGELGPSIIRRIANRDDAQLAAVIRDGLPTRGMPPNKVAEPEMKELVSFLRTLRRNIGLKPVRGTFETVDAKTLEGLVLNRTSDDVQLRTDDNAIHLLRKSGELYREVTSDKDWPTYNGDPGGNRFTNLSQIDSANVARLAPKWIFSLPNAANLEVTPVVVAGVMYVTSANECYALDAGNGRQIWHFQRPRTQGLIGNAASGINRGVAIAGERVFMVTDNAHLLALNRSTGDIVWETEMADWR
ncbi:MAG: Pyrrolo-quinoline quinone, partial [Bryobacterales bacterium]|nr:Pyrrolo-quinoline quinone [Bryobacterales bacterium]